MMHNVGHKMIDDLKTTLMHAKSCYEAWWFLFNPNSSQVSTIVRKYPSYFETVKPALFVTFVIKLASIFDKDNRSINLKALVKKLEIEHNKPFVPKNINFDDLWKRGERLFKYRSMVIAHRDKEVLNSNIAKETGFGYNDLKAILEDACTFLDELLLSTGRRKIQRLPSALELEKIIRDLS